MENEKWEIACPPQGEGYSRITGNYRDYAISTNNFPLSIFNFQISIFHCPSSKCADF